MRPLTVASDDRQVRHPNLSFRAFFDQAQALNAATRRQVTLAHGYETAH
jgi:hypothetical protein